MDLLEAPFSGALDSVRYLPLQSQGFRFFGLPVAVGFYNTRLVAA
jgi:hypothetical protein